MSTSDRTIQQSWCPSRLPLFSYGFRPFFLLAGLSAPLFLVVWLLVLADIVTLPGSVSALAWHSHEMLFGFVAAAIAGFLLTAVPSWTGTKALSGRPLVGLVVVWLAGRVASLPFLADSIPAALIDLAFFPALAAALATPLVRAGKTQNMMFLVLLALLTLGNLLIRLDWLDIAPGATARGLALVSGVVLMMIAVIGGRIIPAFTHNALRARGEEIKLMAPPAISKLALGLTAAAVVVDVLLPETVAAGILALAAGAAHLVRFVHWRTDRTAHDPLLWILHLGYGWVIAALLLKGMWLLGDVAIGAAWQHALNVGAFATMILAVMSRASLGHTGRPLVASGATVMGYAALTAATIARISVPLLPGAWQSNGLALAGSLWILAFGLFVAVYAPILIGPRPDSKLS